MWTPAAREAAAQARRRYGFLLEAKKYKGKSLRAGGGGRFAKTRDAIARSGTASDPSAVAAAIGRRKYGATRFAKFSAQGRRRASRRKRSSK